MYVELSDRTQAFISFMDNFSGDKKELNCDDIFWKCPTDDEDQLFGNYDQHVQQEGRLPVPKYEI